jgi:dTDP-4-amino-4,6-dideoxygalactose transaminase
MKRTKISIIGAGAVGSTIAYALLLKNIAAEICLVDIDETFTVDLGHIEQILKKGSPRPEIKKIKGIVPVHLYGHPANMDALSDLAGRYGLFVLEDCCQAHGARYKAKRVGSWGLQAAFLSIRRKT